MSLEPTVTWMLCRTVLSAKTRLPLVNGAGGMLDGSVSWGVAAHVPTQWSPNPGAPALAAADTLTTVGADGRTTAVVMPAVTTAVSTTADTRPAATTLDGLAGDGPVGDLAVARGPNRVMIDLIDLSNPGERWVYRC